MPRLVYEIGTEEIPPRFLVGAVEQLRSLAKERLEAARLAHGEIVTYATPRRITLVVEGLAAAQESRMREEQGPPASRAFNQDGTPNNAAVGFANRWGVKPEELQVRPTPRGDYVFAVFREEGRAASEVLREVLPTLPGALYFPKTMRWGTGSLRFARPIRWLVALLDEQALDFELDGITTGRQSRGHPVLHPKPITINSAQDYEAALRKARVLVDQGARRRVLVRQLKVAAKEQNARLADSADLIEETVFLVEWPTALVGSFSENYLNLPRPVLMEEMKKVQNFFPLEDPAGKLIARFIGVRDGGKNGLDLVRAGNEGVLRAKFEDATYFYQHDRRKKLVERVEQLKGVIFQAGMGTLYDKALRLQALAEYLADAIGVDPTTKQHASRAAWLAKADLVCDLVVEITSLQGIMGREYALADGEPAEVAQVIGEHYRPKFAGDKLPETSAGRIVALADKLDVVVSGLAAGLSVSGSEDPYGLRREGQAIVSLLVESGFHLSLPQAIGKHLEILCAQQAIKRKPEQVLQEAQALLRQRLERLLKDAPPVGRGVRYDLADAALAAGCDDFAEAAARAEALQTLSGRKDFLPTIVVATRPANIVKGFAGGEPDPALFSEPVENELWQAVLAARPQVDSFAHAGNYIELFSVLAKLRGVIDQFFTEVLVMAQDEQIRRNRLALVWQVNELYRKLADFRLIVQE